MDFTKTIISLALMASASIAHSAFGSEPIQARGIIVNGHARSGRTGGGTALLCRDNLGVTNLAVSEFSEWIILKKGSRN